MIQGSELQKRVSVIDIQNRRTINGPRFSVQKDDVLLLLGVVVWLAQARDVVKGFERSPLRVEFRDAWITESETQRAPTSRRF